MSVRVVVSVIIVAVVLSLIATFLVRAQEPVVKIRPPAPVPEILIDSTFCKQKWQIKVATRLEAIGMSPKEAADFVNDEVGEVACTPRRTLVQNLKFVEHFDTETYITGIFNVHSRHGAEFTYLSFFSISI